MVIFYYPIHFNRTFINGNNEFINPFIISLKNQNISYKIVEEPDLRADYPRNLKATKFDIWFKLILLIRKLLPLAFFGNFESREQWIGKFLRCLTFGSFRAEVVITLSNSMGGFWRGYNPKARIIDYQHGAIDLNQVGFFENKKAPLHMVKNNKEVAVWGFGFKDSFITDNDYYYDKVHVIGYYKPIGERILNLIKRDKILISLQFLPDFGQKLNEEMLQELLIVIHNLQIIPEAYRPKVVLKNHPRHQNIVNLKEVVKQYSAISIVQDNEIINNNDYAMHITFYSTVAFEMAMVGIPTYFLTTEHFQKGRTIFLEEYKYPLLQKKDVGEQWLAYCIDENKWQEDSLKVKEWSDRFFMPFNLANFLSIIGVRS